MYPVLTSIFIAWELSEIVSNTPENNFYSRIYYLFFLQILHPIPEEMFISQSYLPRLLTIHSHTLCFHSNARLLLREAVRGPKQGPLPVTWPPESHFYTWDKLFSDKSFCSRRMCPCSLTASAIVHALVSLYELQGASLPVNILMKVPIDALNEGPKQQGYVCMCMCEEEQKWMKCVGMCACQARIK